MRFIFGIGGKLFVWETSVARVTMRLAGKSSEDDDEGEEDFKHIPQDPHGTNGAHLEISPDAIGAYGKRRIGFSGSEGSSKEGRA
jgi:hypothetical protein